MRLALVTFERIQERLSEASLDVKGKVNSWMEGGLEHSGLVQGVKLMLEKLSKLSRTYDNWDNAKEIISTSGSPREQLIRVGHGRFMYMRYKCAHAQYTCTCSLQDC